MTLERRPRFNQCATCISMFFSWNSRKQIHADLVAFQVNMGENGRAAVDRLQAIVDREVERTNRQWNETKDPYYIGKLFILQHWLNRHSDITTVLGVSNRGDRMKRAYEVLSGNYSFYTVVHSLKKKVWKLFKPSSEHSAKVDTAYVQGQMEEIGERLKDENARPEMEKLLDHTLKKSRILADIADCTEALGRTFYPKDFQQQQTGLHA